MEGCKIPLVARMRKQEPTATRLFCEDLIIEAISKKQHTDDSYLFQLIGPAYGKWEALSASERDGYYQEASALEAVYAEAGYKSVTDGRGEAVVAGKKRKAGNLKKRKPLTVYSQILRELSKKKKGFTSEKPKAEALKPGEDRFTSEEPKAEALKPGEAVIARLRKNKPSAFGLFIEALIKEANEQEQHIDSFYLDQILQESRDKWRSLSASGRAGYTEKASALEAVYAEARDKSVTKGRGRAVTLMIGGKKRNAGVSMKRKHFTSEVPAWGRCRYCRRRI